MTPDETNQVQNDGLQAEVEVNTAENAEQVAINVPEVDETATIEPTVELEPADNAPVAPEVTQETQAEVEPAEPKGEFPLATVKNANGESREYSYGVHGENYAELAEQYATKIGGKVIYG